MEICQTPLPRGLLLALALSLSGCGSIFCPGDVTMSPVTTVNGGHATAAACAAALAAGTCAPLITAPTAACTTHCRSGTFGAFCGAKATNASFVTSQACYPVDTTPVTYAYSCVKTATCPCF